MVGIWLACGEAPVVSEPGLGDPNPEDRKAALYALEPQGVRDNLWVLIDMAQDDPEPTVRRLAMGLLGPSEDPRVVPLLQEALGNWRDTSGQLTAATALGNVRHQDACVVLVDAWIAWPTEGDALALALQSALIASDPVCNPLMHARKSERPQRIGQVLLAISRNR